MLDPFFNSEIVNNLLLQPWFQFVFVFITAVLASTKVTLQGAACRRHIRNSQDSLLYNTMFFTSVAIFLSLTLNMGMPNSEILIWALIQAVGTVAFQVIYSVALTEGPISITVLIINFGVVIPTILSAVIFREHVFYSQLFGIICLLISFPLSMKESGEGEKKATKKWLILTLLTLITNSVVMTVQKLFGRTNSFKVGGEIASNTYLLFIYIFGAIVAFLVYLFFRKFGSKESSANKHTFKFGRSIVAFALGMGLVLAVYQKFYMTANLKLDGAFFFPTITGLQSINMTAVGIILFGDRLNKRQWIGVIFGILAVVLLNFKVGPYFVIG